VSGWSALHGFLTTDPDDAGCGRTLELLEIYADLVIANAGPEVRYPDIAAHLRACDPCADDLAGLVAAARDNGS